VIVMDTPVPTLSAAAQTKARRTLLKSYPFLRRVRAEVQPTPDAHFVLRFQLTTALADGGTLRQEVRATVTPKGNVVKVVTSR
jgi:hypothetical protein